MRTSVWSTAVVAASILFGFEWSPSIAARAIQEWTVIPPLAANGGIGRQLSLDLDGDGYDEVVLLGHPAQWNRPLSYDALTVLGRAPSPSQELRRIYSRVDNPIESLFRIANVDGSPGSSVLAFSYDATHVLSGISLDVAATFPPCQWVSAVGDVSGDGSLQAVGFSSTGLEIRDVRSGEIVRSIRGTFGAIALAQLDTDPALEIIIEGTSLRVIDAVTLMLEWSYPNGGRNVSVGTAEDGTNRFVFTAHTNEVVAVDANPPHVVWTIPAPVLTSFRYQLADLDRDGRSELLRWTSSEHEIAVLDATTQQRRFVLDGSSTNNAYMTARLSDEPYNTLVSVANPYAPDPRSDIAAILGKAGSVEQLQPAEGPSFSRLAVGDIDGDGRQEVVVASTAKDGRDVVRILDRASGAEKGLMRIERGTSGSALPVRAIALARTSAAQPPKIFVENQGSILAIDGISQRVLYSLGSRNPALNGLDVSVLRTADLDGDGNEEMLVGAGLALLVVDPATSQIKWSVSLDDPLSDLQTMPAGDGKHTDVLAFTADHSYRIGSADHRLRWVHAFESLHPGISDAIGTYVEHGVAGAEVVVARSEAGAFYVLDADTGATLRDWNGRAVISFLAAPGGRIDRLLVSSGLGLAVLNGVTFVTSSWPPVTTALTGARLGHGNNSFIAADPASGRHAFVIGSDGGISSFYANDRETIFADGFEISAQP